MKRKRKKKQIKAGFASNIKIKNKVSIIIVTLMICFIVIAYGSYYIVSSMITANKKESERLVAASAQRYVENEIDSMVRISESVYRNEDIYSVIGKQYSSVVDYHEAFFDFDRNKFPSTTAGSAVEQLIVYTANDTVMSGKYISRLSDVKNEEWYIRYLETDRDVILFCSGENNQLSLIRRLNYKKTGTGDAVLKLDFNSSRIAESFEKMGFEGSVYAAADRKIICSNTRNDQLPSADELTDYYRTYKNYYTCNIDFYVKANRKTIIPVFAIPFSVPLLVILILGVVFVIIIIDDFKNRTLEVCNICDGRKKTDIHKRSLGRDEIGRLYDDVSDKLTDLKRLADERKNMKDFVDEYKGRTNEVILSALNYETMKKFGLASMEKVSVPVSLDEELLNLSDFLNELKEREYFKYSLLSDTTSKVKNVIPYSFAAVALHVAQYNGTGAEVEIDICEHDGCYSVRFHKAGTFLASADVLKLRAIFEPEGSRGLPSYYAEDEFNPYVRLSRFYLDDITLNINSKEELDFEFIITTRAGGRGQ